MLQFVIKIVVFYHLVVATYCTAHFKKFIDGIIPFVIWLELKKTNCNDFSFLPKFNVFFPGK